MAPTATDPEQRLLYGIDDVPPGGQAFVFGLQHVLTMFGATVSVPLILRGALGMDDAQTAILVTAVMLTSGIATLLQATIGSRLPIIQGVSFSFLAAFFAVASQYKQAEAMQYIAGAILLGSLLEMAIGWGGLIGLVRRIVTPVVIGPVIMLIGLALFAVGAPQAGLHWPTSILTIVLIFLFSQVWSRRSRLLRMFPILLAVVVAWVVALLIDYLGGLVGRARGWRVATEHFVEADIVVLAAHAIENAKIMLASGLGRVNDNIGRNLMDHPLYVAQGLMQGTGNIGPFRGPGITSAFDGFRDGAWRKHFAPYRIGIFNWGWSWKLGSPVSDVQALVDHGGLKKIGQPPGPQSTTPVLGRALHSALGAHLPRQFQLEFLIEQLADRENRVTIDPRHRDRLGNHRPVLTYKVDDYVAAGFDHAAQVAKKLFRWLDVEPWSSPPTNNPKTTVKSGTNSYEFFGAGHGAGTHIMGTKKEDSVVDEWQRSFDVENLYAVGSGSMPSMGTSNPTLTMAALAFRTSEEIHRDLLKRNRPADIYSKSKQGAP